MTTPSNRSLITALLSFNGGFVDTAGFLGLAGLFTAHVTGNFVTLAAALVTGSHGIIGKLIALPEFVLVVALARLAGSAMRARTIAPLRPLLIAKVVLLAAFFAAAVGFGPFPNADAPAALITGFFGIAAMAIQNAVQRVHLSSLPPTTLMTGSTTQVVLDAVDLATGIGAAPPTRERARRLSLAIVCFAAGCAAAALLYWLAGFWCLAIPVVFGAATAVMRLEPAPQA
jgi:uncharacterized membrane protein YoaK (UPF0700 family)